MQQLAPKLAEQLENSVAQLTQLVGQMQQSYGDFTKRMADLEGQMLLEELYQELYEDPPGAPPGWWLQKRRSPMHPQD